MGCPRSFCPSCDEEMIHRDHRRFYESASGFGQIVSRDGPRSFTVGDVDLYHWKSLGDIQILRLLEHKQRDQPIKPMQRKVLRFLETVIAHATDCPLSPLRLHPSSSAYIFRGDIHAESNGRRKTWMGSQNVWNPRSGWFHLGDQTEVFAWLDGQP